MIKIRKNILVPTDGSKDANLALKEAISFAKILNEKIILLNVQPNLTTYNTRRFFSESEIREYEKQLSEEALAPALEVLKEAGIQYEVKVRIGDAKQQIMQEAKEQQVRTIVIGAKGQGAILGTLLGSVSHGLVQQSPCPVMVVSSRQENVE